MVSLGSLTIRRIGVGSALKVGAISGFFIWAVLGLLFIVLEYILLSNQYSGYYGYTINFGSLLGVYLVGFIVYPIAFGIGSAISAWGFNTAVGWVGGLELEVDATGYVREDKAKSKLGTL